MKNKNEDIKNEVLRKLQDPKFYADDELVYTNDAMSKYTNNQAHAVNDPWKRPDDDCMKIRYFLKDH